MNWLAHLYLSEPTPSFRIGNVLPDMLSMAELAQLPPEFQAGVERHRKIDAFTDAHPIVRRSIGRFNPTFRRFAGVLTDIFYDHFLACHWNLYADMPLETFAQEVYASFELHRSDIPNRTYTGLQHMKAQNWLVSYRDIEGIRVTLTRVDARLRRSYNLGDSVIELEENYVALEADFLEFFPDLKAHVMLSQSPDSSVMKNSNAGRNSAKF